MDTTTLEHEVRVLVGNILEMEPDKIDPSANLVEDLGMDSMMALEILATLEKKFKIKIPENELPKIATLQGAIDLTKQYAK